MPKKSEKPFNKIMLTRSKLRLYIEHGDHALGEQAPQEFLADVQECLEYLMEFRNIINGMVSFDEAPSRAVVPYLPYELLKETAEKIDA